MTPLQALAKVLQLSQQPLDKTFTAASDAKLAKVEIGQQVSAKVEELLQNGNFKVSIAGQSLQMNLPQGTKTGDSVDLVLISREPRLTFRLDQPQQSSPALSSAGRLVAQLLPDPSKPTPPLTSANPVLPSPALEPKQIAQALHNTLSQSGLFYESHQAQWVMGERPLAQLLLEPQNAGVPQGTSMATPMPETAKTAPEAKLPEAPFPSGMLQTGTTPPASDKKAAEPAQADVSKPEAAVRQEILPVVRQQIEAIESREFNWSGQIWPGQTMDWQVREETPEKPHQDEPASVWQSRIRLTLPVLGQVDAYLRLTPAGVSLSLHAEKTQAENQLRANGKMLQESLNASGIPLVSMTVKHG